MALPRNGRDAILTRGSDSLSALHTRVQCNKRLRQSVAQESDGSVTVLSARRFATQRCAFAPGPAFAVGFSWFQTGCARSRADWGWRGRMLAQPGLSRKPYFARGSARPFAKWSCHHERATVPTTRTVLRFTPRLASTRQDCIQDNRVRRGGEKRGWIFARRSFLVSLLSG